METSVFKQLMGKNVTAVSVVTTALGGEKQGMTVNAFLSVSVNPPTMLVSLTTKSRTAELVARSKKFSVCFLSNTQSELSDRFAGRHKDKEDDRFDGLSWKMGKSGVPVFSEVMGSVECVVRHEYAGADHTLFVGEVVEAFVDEKRSPLLYSQGKYVG